eukprot:TRINITY_DN1866_c0_g2_i1.p1 TRINITY_DN1866_c0_g2~~TRINITY_DN1866_c0_g2_i1.p1  ORF type:complete len:1951 (-),score=559.27 TRINITY_DN1866_c0_g2_i1:2287-8139(-)
MKLPASIRARAPMTAPASITTCGPMTASAATLADGSTTALAWMPAPGTTSAMAWNSCAARAKQAQGLRVTIRAPPQACTWASSASDRISAAACVWSACARNLGLERKVIWVEPAASSGAMPWTAMFASPFNCPPKRSTNCSSRILILAFRMICVACDTEAATAHQYDVAAPEATCGRQGLAPRARTVRKELLCQFLQDLVGNVDALAGVHGLLEDDVVLFSFGDLADHLVGALQHHSQFLVATLVQVFAEFTLLALEFLVQIGQVALALGTVGVGQHGGILVQLLGLGLQACSHILQVAVALGELGFQLRLRRLGRCGFAEDALGADEGDFGAFLRVGRGKAQQAGSHHDGLQGQERFGHELQDYSPYYESMMPALEAGTQLELEGLRLVAVFEVQRLAETELQGADRRHPTDTHTGGIAQVVELDVLAVGEDVAAVEEGEPAQRAILARTRERELQLRVGIETRGATHGIAVLVLQATQRGGFIATHGPDTTGVVVLEHRVRLAADATTVVQLAVQGQGHGLAEEGLEVLVLVAGAVVLQRTDGRDFQVGALVAAHGRHQGAIATVALPGHRQREAGGTGAADTAIGTGRGIGHIATCCAGATEVTHILTIQRGAGGVGGDVGVFDTDAEEDAIQFRERHAELDATAQRLDLVVTGGIDRRTQGTQVDFVGAADAVIGEVRIGGRQRDGAIARAGIDVQAHGVAAAEGVFLRDRAGQAELVGLREAGTDHDVAGRFFLDLHVHVDLVVAAGHFRRIDGDFLEVAQAVHAVARELDLLAVVPGILELAEFATDDFIAGLGIAGDVDMAHVDALARVDHDGEGNFLLLAVHVRVGVHVGEGITEVTQALADLLGAVGELGTGIDITLLQLHQLGQLGVHAKHLAFQLDVGDGVLLAFLDVDGDVDVLLVGRDRHLGRFDLHFQITTIQIVGTQGLDVALQLFLGILVGLGVPGEPARRGQLDLVAQGAVGEHLVAHEVDLLDARDVTFIHREGNGHTVALDRRHRGGYLGAIQAAREILALQLLLGTINLGAVEDARFGHADFLQGLAQLFLVELLDAGEVDAGDGRTLDHLHHQHVALGLDAHIAEETGGIQGLDGGGALFIVEGIAHAHRQVAEDRTCLGTLDAFDADILDHEGRDRHGLAGAQGKGGCGDQATGECRDGMLRRVQFHLSFINSFSPQHCLTRGWQGIENGSLIHCQLLNNCHRGWPANVKNPVFLAEPPIFIDSDGIRPDSSLEHQSHDIVESRNEHQRHQYSQAGALRDFPKPLGNGPPCQNLQRIIQQMTAIQHRDRQQIHHTKADTDEGHEAQIADQAYPGGLSGIVGDGDGTGNVLQGDLADDHATDHLDGHRTGIPGTLRPLGQGLQRGVADGGHLRRQRYLDLDATDTLGALALPFIHHFRSDAHIETCRTTRNLQCQRTTGRFADLFHEGQAILHRLAIDGQDAVPGLQAGRLGRPVHDAAQHGGRARQRQAQLAQEIAFQVIAIDAGQAQRHGIEQLAAAVVGIGALYVQARIGLFQDQLHQLPAQLGPDLHRCAIDRSDAVARPQTGLVGGTLLGAGAQQGHRLRHAVHVKSGKQQDGQQEIGDRAGGHDGNAAPHRLAGEFAGEIGCRDILDRLFARIQHLHIAAQRQDRQGPLGLVATEAARPDHPAHAHRKAQYLDPAPARHQVVAQLVYHHQGTQCDEECEEGMQQRHGEISVSAQVRACLSCSSNASISSAWRLGMADMTWSIRGAIRPNPIRRSRKACTATSLAALRMAANVPPARKASYASFRQAKRWQSGWLKDNCAICARSSGATPEAIRSGQASALAMGVRMSGLPSCASTEPSAQETMEWITLCGWITTSILSAGAPKSQCASITSRPLFIMVAESTEILRPMTHLGCATASSTVTRSRVLTSRVRKGPPEAVRRIFSTPWAAIERLQPAGRHWKMALCSLSMGSRLAPWVATVSMSS